MAAATPEGPGETDESEGAESAEGAVVATTPAVVPGIRLAAGVTLLLDGDLGPITAADLAAIEVAARPLLNALRSRGLHTERTPEPAKPADLPGSPESSEPAASPDSAEATEPHPPPHPPGRRSM
jgi:hypothetical protein